MSERETEEGERHSEERKTEGVQTDRQSASEFR